MEEYDGRREPVDEAFCRQEKESYSFLSCIDFDKGDGRVVYTGFFSLGPTFEIKYLLIEGPY